METNSNEQPMHRRQRFSFEAFDSLCASALDETPPEPKKPGEIGGVLIRLSTGWNSDGEYTTLPEPPDAA